MKGVTRAGKRCPGAVGESNQKDRWRECQRTGERVSGRTGERVPRETDEKIPRERQVRRVPRSGR